MRKIEQRMEFGDWVLTKVRDREFGAWALELVDYVDRECCISGLSLSETSDVVKRTAKDEEPGHVVNAYCECDMCATFSVFALEWDILQCEARHHAQTRPKSITCDPTTVGDDLAKPQTTYFSDLNLTPSPANNRNDTHSYVYFIQAANGPIKIGTTRDLKQRLRGLQTANHEELHIRLAIPGDRHVEAKFHALFAKDRLHGEWFSESEALKHTIDELATSSKAEL